MHTTGRKDRRQHDVRLPVRRGRRCAIPWSSPLRNAAAYGVSLRLRAADLGVNNLVGFTFTTGEVLTASDVFWYNTGGRAIRIVTVPRSRPFRGSRTRPLERGSATDPGRSERQ
jgi:hypothetical protein